MAEMEESVFQVQIVAAGRRELSGGLVGLTGVVGQEVWVILSCIKLSE
jgi:hypothetical protein